MKRKIAAMREAFGTDEANVCRDCCNFMKVRHHDRILRKCKAYGVTHSEASDWSGSWIACGHFGVPFPVGHRTLMETRKCGKRIAEIEPIEGQEKWKV